MKDPVVTAEQEHDRRVLSNTYDGYLETYAESHIWPELDAGKYDDESLILSEFLDVRLVSRIFRRAVLGQEQDEGDMKDARLQIDDYVKDLAESATDDR